MLKYRFTITGGLIIAVLSLIPGNQLPETEVKYADLSIHVLMYGIWVFFIFREIIPQYSMPTSRFIYVIIMFLTVAYGGIMELLQEKLISGRFGSIADTIANCIGMFVGFLAYTTTEAGKI